MVEQRLRRPDDDVLTARVMTEREALELDRGDVPMLDLRLRGLQRLRAVTRTSSIVTTAREKSAQRLSVFLHPAEIRV